MKNCIKFPVRLALLLSTSLLLACTSSPSTEPLESQAQATSTFTEGVPGGSFSQVEQTSAVITAIDYKTRRVSLKDGDGNVHTVTALPDVKNLDKVKVGDQVFLTAATETVVSLQESAEPSADDAVGLVAQPQGSEVGVVRAISKQVTVVVTAVDASKHEVTLQFPDQGSETLPVRKDVILTQALVGKKVVISVTKAMAIRVEKP